MKYHKMTAKLEFNLEIVTAEVRETAKALIEFAEKLEEIDRKYKDMYQDKSEVEE